jgi:hypothetical protein
VRWNHKFNKWAQPNIDWDRPYQEDPIEWVRQREVMRENQEKAAAIQSEQQRLSQLSQQEQAQFMQQKLQQEQRGFIGGHSLIGKTSRKLKLKRLCLWSSVRRSDSHPKS